MLDVGCGVGGPAREIATFTGCNVTGLNNNSYQIQRGNAYAKKAGLEKQVSFVKGDFMVSFGRNQSPASWVHSPSAKS